MYKFLLKNGQLAALLVGLVTVIIFIVTALSGLKGAGIDLGANLNDLPDEVTTNLNAFNVGLKLAMFLTIVALLAWIVLGILGIAKNPKNSMKGAIGFGGLLIVFGILYAMSTSETTGKISDLIAKNNISETASKLISGGLKAAVLLAAVGVLILIVSEVRNAFK